MAKCYVVQREWRDCDGDEDRGVPHIFLQERQAKEKFSAVIGEIMTDWEEFDFNNLEINRNTTPPFFELYDKDTCEFDRVTILERELIE